MSQQTFSAQQTLPHTHSEGTPFMNVQLPEQWFGQEKSTLWCTPSPDLITFTFFLWGFANNEISVLPLL
jgi:hypothetical protein